MVLVSKDNKILNFLKFELKKFEFVHKGKSTFLKLLMGELEPNQGDHRKNHRLVSRNEKSILKGKSPSRLVNKFSNFSTAYRPFRSTLW